MSSLKKRDHVRFSVHWRAAVFIASQGGEKATPATVVDISLSGAAITVDTAMRAGELYRIAIAIPTFDRRDTKYIEGQFRVVSSFCTAGTFRVGLCREQMSETCERDLLWFLREEAKRLEWAYSKASGSYEFVKESY
jgi:c-di-GMP-binding flagellar brake protein YcgR